MSAQAASTASDRPDKSRTEASNIVFLGLDLGTSESAIATSSGLKLSVASVVGWPKDFVAHNVVKGPLVLGDECIKHRTSLEVIYPLERGVIKYRENGQPKKTREATASIELLKHLFGLVDRDDKDKIYAVVGAPAGSSKEDKQAIIASAAGLVDSLLVVSEPFLVAYNLGTFDRAIIVDLGAGTLDICRMPGSIPGEEDQRTLYAAGNEIDARFVALMEESHPGIHINLPLAKKIKEENAFVGEGTDRIEMEFNISGKLTTVDISNELREACSIVLPAICDTVRELIISFDPEFMGSLAKNIILAGGGSGIRGLAQEIQRNLSEDLGTVVVTVADDPMFCGAMGALKLAREMPMEEWN